MPPTPYNPHSNPSIYYQPKPPVGPKPPKPQTWAGAGAQVTPPRVNYNVPPTTEFSPGANAPRPPSPVYAPPAGGGGAPAGDYWNGMRVLQRSPGGNVLVDENGVPTAYDPWGNKIPHLYAGAAGGDPNGGGQGGGGGGAAPVATPTTPGVPTPVQGTPATFYAPTTGSPYLQLGNLLAYMNDPQRQQLDSVLKGAGFQPTGEMNTYGTSGYVKPPQFDQTDVNNLALSDSMRQWLRFALGYLGWGSSYQLPQGYVPGSGLPTPPQWPMPTTMPTPDPYTP